MRVPMNLKIWGFRKIDTALALNQTVWNGVTASLAYLHDEFDINDRDVVLGQLAVEF